jgi:hypothetical protein
METHLDLLPAGCTDLIVRHTTRQARARTTRGGLGNDVDFGHARSMKG